MAKFELNIYGENDEVIKKYETDHIRYGTFVAALKLDKELDESDIGEKFKAVSEIVKKIFPGLTDEEIEKADYNDVFATFAQLKNKSADINSSNESKN